jgi:putative phosphoribosyl transferase
MEVTMFRTRRYHDRAEGGRALAEALRFLKGEPSLVVLALPRGGVPVGYTVARSLDAPLDVFVVRKLGVPGQEELAMGAIASGGALVMNDEVLGMIDVPREAIKRSVLLERRELERREEEYRGDRPPLDVVGRTVVIVDDGLATGSTMRAAVAALRSKSPRRIIVAVPVAARETCEMLASEVDEVICPWTPEPFNAVGLWYEDFSQTTDGEVRDLLDSAGGVRASARRQR